EYDALYLKLELENMKKIETVGIVGAGAMGRGIAQIAAQAGLTVRLFDLNEQAVTAAREQLQQIWQKLADKGKVPADSVQTWLANVQACNDLAQMADAQLVVEAVIEKLEVKRELFQKLEDIVEDDCILASNTSSLSIT